MEKTPTSQIRYSQDRPGHLVDMETRHLVLFNLVQMEDVSEVRSMYAKFTWTGYRGAHHECRNDYPHCSTDSLSNGRDRHPLRPPKVDQRLY